MAMHKRAKVKCGGYALTTIGLQDVVRRGQGRAIDKRFRIIEYLLALNIYEELLVSIRRRAGIGRRRRAGGGVA